MNEQVRDVLREAKGLITRSWFQGSYGAGNQIVGEGPLMCPHTAVATAARKSALKKAVLAALCSELCVADIAGVWRWNDAPERTHAEVVALFDKVLTGDTPPVPDPEDSRERVFA